MIREKQQTPESSLPVTTAVPPMWMWHPWNPMGISQAGRSVETNQMHGRVVIASPAS